jgi:hypothetical protein
MKQRGLAFVVAALAFLPAAAAAQQCKANFGELIDVDRCGGAEVSVLKIRFLGVSQREPNLPLRCWNYEVAFGAERTFVNYCHTGELGGTQEFQLGGRKYRVDFDSALSEKPPRAGHRFFEY